MELRDIYILELELVAIVLLPFLLALLFTKLIIQNSEKIGVLDKPNGRKTHSKPVPPLGGVAVMTAIIVGSLPFVHFTNHDTLLFTLACTLSLTILGVYDDIRDASPVLRLLVEIVLVTVLFHFTELSVSPLFSFLGIENIPVFIDWFLTVLLCVAMINAFNFMDGINGLSGGIFTINFSILSICFYLHKDYELMVMTGLAAAATFGFLRFNFYKASIFMGDGGSIALGFLNVVSVLLLMDRTQEIHVGNFSFESIAIVSLLVIPAIDMLKVIYGRVRQGKSPMEGDRTHLHHLFLEKTKSHLKSTVSILSFHVALIATIIVKISLGIHLLFSIPVLLIFFYLLYKFANRIKTKRESQQIGFSNV